MLQTLTLKNGIKVATYSVPQMKSVYISAAVKAGSIFDTKKTSGTAHFMEHILVQGTPNFPSVEVLSDYIESLAGNYNAFTDIQIIKFYINGPINHLEDLVKITSEVFFEPLFPETSIERERGAIREEIKERLDRDWYKKSEFFRQVRYRKNHPLLPDGGGTIETINKITKKNIVDYWSKFFYPKNTYLSIVGGFDTIKLKDLLNQYFGKNKSKKSFPGYPAVSNNDLSDRQVAIRFDKSLNTCNIDFSFPSIGDDKPLPMHIPQNVANNILGRLHSSRLYRLLRQQLGLVYSINMGSVTYQNFGYVYISTQVDAEKVLEVISLITKELSKFLSKGPTEDEINFAKNYAINRVLMQFDHPRNIADWIEDDLLWQDKVYTTEEYVELIKKVTKKDIMEFMQKYWDFSKLNLVVQGKVENSKANIKKFEKILKVL